MISLYMLVTGFVLFLNKDDYTETCPLYTNLDELKRICIGNRMNMRQLRIYTTILSILVTIFVHCSVVANIFLLFTPKVMMIQRT